MGEAYPASAQTFIQAESTTIDAIPASNQRFNTRQFIVAVDFGTTFSSVSVCCRRGADDIDSSQINSISNYPDAGSLFNQGPSETPTQSWYPKQGMPLRQPIDTQINIGDEEDRDEAHNIVEDGIMVDTHIQNTSDHGNSSPANNQGDIIVIDSDGDDVMDEDDGVLDLYYWGYGVSKILAGSDTHRDQSRCISRSKLLLDNSVHTRHIRSQLSKTVKDLRGRALIRDESDIIADFLSHLLSHTKSQMATQYQYNSDCSVEFVLCIPAMWTEKACRTMQNAMTRALRESGFIENSNQDVDNLFIITEPEAASTHVLDKLGDIMVCY